MQTVHHVTAKSATKARECDDMSKYIYERAR